MGTDKIPLGTFDAFKDVSGWDEQTAQNWVNALNLRAAAPDQQNLRARLVRLANPGKGGTALEIGCGTGALLCELARAVGARGRVIGFEPQSALAAEARRRLREEGFAERAEVRTESALRLPIEDESADACLAQTVLIHLPPEIFREGVAEMVRAAKKGGRVVTCDQDGDTWTIDHPDRELTRRIVRFNSDQRYADGWTGRKLRRSFKDAGLADVQIETIVHTDTEKNSYLFGMAERIANAAAEAGAVSREDLEKWLSDLYRAAEAGNFFSGINYYLCRGLRV